MSEAFVKQSLYTSSDDCKTMESIDVEKRFIECVILSTESLSLPLDSCIVIQTKDKHDVHHIEKRHGRHSKAAAAAAAASADTTNEQQFVTFPLSTICKSDSCYNNTSEMIISLKVLSIPLSNELSILKRIQIQQEDTCIADMIFIKQNVIVIVPFWIGKLIHSVSLNFFYIYCSIELITYTVSSITDTDSLYFNNNNISMINIFQDFVCCCVEGPLVLTSYSSIPQNQSWLNIWYLSQMTLDHMLLSHLSRYIICPNLIFCIPFNGILGTFRLLSLLSTDMKQIGCQDRMGHTDYPLQKQNDLTRYLFNNKNGNNSNSLSQITSRLIIRPFIQHFKYIEAFHLLSKKNHICHSTTSFMITPPPHFNEFIKECTRLKNQTINPLLPPPPFVFYKLLTHLTFEDDYYFMHCVLHDPLNKSGSIQIHPLPLNIHLSQVKRYRHIISSRLLGTKHTPVKPSSRLGSLVPTSDIGKFVIRYLKYRIRQNIVHLLELYRNHQNTHQSEIIVLYLQHIQCLTQSECNDIKHILQTFINEMTEYVTRMYVDKIHLSVNQDTQLTTFIPRESYKQTSRVFLPIIIYVMTSWDTQCYGLPPTNIIEFFDRLHIPNSVNALLGLHTEQDDVHSIIRQRTRNESKNLMEMNGTQLYSDMAHWRKTQWIESIKAWKTEYMIKWNPIMKTNVLNVLLPFQSLLHDKLNLMSSFLLLKRLIIMFQLIVQYIQKNKIHLLKNIRHTFYSFRHICPDLDKGFESTHQIVVCHSSENVPKINPLVSLQQCTPKQKQAIFDLEFFIFFGLQNPDIFLKAHLVYKPRALLYGESGTGKTYILNYLQQHYKHIPMSIIHISSLYSPYLGETEKNLRDHFTQCKYQLPMILVLEGLEFLICKDTISGDEFRRRLLTSLLLCLDSVDSPNDQLLGLMGVIGVSRLQPELLDPALVRPGRLDRWISLDQDP